MQLPYLTLRRVKISECNVEPHSISTIQTENKKASVAAGPTCGI